jgi:hypothetical protein
LLDGATSTDEYLTAILRSNNAIVRLLGGQVEGSDGIGVVPPDDTAGIAVNGADQGDVGDFLYKNSGRTVLAKVRAARNLEPGGVAKYDSNQGGLIPIETVEQGDLDFGAISAALSNAGDFTFIDTDFQFGDGGGNVTISPGETKEVLTASFNNEVGLYEVGTNDETYSEYQYYIDGEALLESRIPKPLGLYDTRFEFPRPLRVTSSFTVEVRRSSAAPGSADYFSNAVLQ